MASMYEQLCEENLKTFITAEYAKRNFEQSEDAEWLLCHWDRLIQVLWMPKNADVYYHIYVANEFMIYYKYGNFIKSPIVDKYKDTFDLVIETDPRWCRKMSDLGEKYGVSPAELVHPYKIDDALEYIYKNNKIDLPLPKTITNGIEQGFDGVNTEGALSYYVNILDEDFSLDFIMKSIKYDVLNRYVYNVMYENIDKYKDEIDSAVRNIVMSNSHDNSVIGRLYGLLRWDFNLEKIKRSQYKDKIKDIGWDLCRGNKVCKDCASGTCDATLKRQLYTAIRSITERTWAGVSSKSIPMPENAEKKFDRIPLPPIEEKKYIF